MDRSLTAGTLLRQARIAAGLSQAELATKASTTQSVISMYESGRRQPSLPTLAGLIEATGAHLDVRLDSTSSPSALLADRVHDRASAVRDAARNAGVAVLGLFGSAARRDDHPGSDVDLLIDVPDGVGLFTLGRLRAELRDLLEAEIDLVPRAGLKPHVRRSVEAELQPL